MKVAEKSKGREKSRAPVQAAGGIVVRGAGAPLIGIVRLRKDNAWVLPKGKLKPGRTLSVPKAFKGFKKVKYVWLRNGKPIKRATKRSYRLRRGDRGKRISCKITLTPAGGGKALTVTTAALKIPRR